MSDQFDESIKVIDYLMKCIKLLQAEKRGLEEQNMRLDRIRCDLIPERDTLEVKLNVAHARIQELEGSQ